MSQIIFLFIGLLIGILVAPINIKIEHTETIPTIKEVQLSEEDVKNLEAQQAVHDAVRGIQDLFGIGGDDDEA